VIVEKRTYTLHPGKASEYLRIYQETGGCDVQRRILGNLVGWFTTEIGNVNQIVHMWAYTDLNDRAKRRAELAADPTWQKYLPQIRPLVISQESCILVPAPFSPWAKMP
jgi:hypothetical protein